ncbi:MAG: NAD(P)H-dependent oxidoreductase subunit E [Parvularculaceae bacterium]|nr:NAD(P)H-dependent oxidoreductase subunit E [Parvularculaceae bacterium]
MLKVLLLPNSVKCVQIFARSGVFTLQSKAMDVSASRVRDLATPFVGRTGGLISALREIQLNLAHIPVAADAIVADLFNLSRAEVAGVVSFYADFSRQAKPATIVRICQAEACQAAGGRELQRQAQIKWGKGGSGSVGLEPVYCLGLCSVAPAAMVGERLIGRASVATIEAILAKSEEGARSD